MSGLSMRARRDAADRSAKRKGPHSVEPTISAVETVLDNGKFGKHTVKFETGDGGVTSNGVPDPIAPVAKFPELSYANAV